MTWRERLEELDLPPLPARVVIAIIAFLGVFALLPQSDRFGYLFGILAAATFLSILELYRPGDDRRPVEHAIDIGSQAVVAAILQELGPISVSDRAATEVDRDAVLVATYDPLVHATVYSLRRRPI